MSFAPPILTAKADHAVLQGWATWLNRSGSAVAVTELYDVTDPTDEVEDVVVPPGMSEWVVTLLVNPADLPAVTKILGL